ncbi:sigma-54 dependent transcriptional regulator [Breoghania sp. L-A4]|uniref:sigma-54-dependent transcriptional regulator n=1 Tax=Breoghania sp. L-A4 TaxID=2304600 RepID=UPI000E3596DA|nr:sigma-54 dependent transcriptional regulator [Breoghania sp. L-A4]AXS41849.1 sigma-54-dependent Fis family transcriptional regulator [Breoghania sp. L-A4]
MSGRILIVDDDPIQRRLLEEAVKRFGYSARVVEDGAQAVAVMTGPEGSDMDLVILDLVMPELDGHAVLGKMREKGIATPVIVQTAQAGIDTVVGAMRAGAQDFVVKPVSPERLEVSIRNVLKVSALQDEITRIRKSAAGTLTFDDIITRSPAMERVLRLGDRAASSNIPILIEGESGVGKELIARAIQGSGDRASKPFVTVNCGAIPENLVESILFGHEKGAFTGATEKHVGKFQEAHGGTLFLDEVGELPLDVQVKLLRALQESEIDPVGARRPVRIDFRMISATNRRLLDLVKEGRFREDLYYRLNVFPIWIPPLRDRLEDIPDLARHFLARFAAEENKPQVASIAPETIALLQSFDWPGNIRQLENAVFRAVVLCDDTYLQPEDFPQIQAMRGSGGAGAIPAGAPGGYSGGDMIGVAAPRPSVQAGTGESADAPGEAYKGHGDLAQGGFAGVAEGVAPFGFMRALDDTGHVKTLEAVERDMIVTAIDHYGGRMAEVARRLDIGRSTLYRKLKDYGLDGSSDQAASELDEIAARASR